MSTLELFNLYPGLLITFIILVGLAVGSFLNVVIYRLPIMMERSWREDCQEFLEIANDPVEQDKFDLCVPDSSCPHCKQNILFHHNIPIISFLLLKGRCHHCHEKISIRYPIVELFTGIVSALIAWHFGYTVEMACALLLTWSLIALSGIDIDRQLLPDSITLPLIWFGLFLSLFNIFTDSHSSIIGALFGYLFLWSIFHLFKLVTGKEGMGYGDFKLLAVFGAWLGWQYILTIILLSSLVAAIVGITLVLFRQHERDTPIPFGPYLAAAGWIALIWGQTINQIYFDFSGL